MRILDKFKTLELKNLYKNNEQFLNPSLKLFSEKQETPEYYCT